MLQHEYRSHRNGVGSISTKLSTNRKTLRNCVNRAETDTGRKPSLTAVERARGDSSRLSLVFSSQSLRSALALLTAPYRVRSVLWFVILGDA